MYHDLREIYWWDDMKKEIIEFVECQNCQHIRVGNQRLGGLARIIELLGWKVGDYQIFFQ